MKKGTAGVTGILVGALSGATAMALLTKKTGKENRDMLKSKADEVITKTTDTVSNVKEKAESLMKKEKED